MTIQSLNNDIEDAEAWLYYPTLAMSYTIRNMDIVYVLDGELEIKKEQDKYRLKRTDILLINPPISSYERALPPNVKFSPIKNCCFLLLRLSPLFISTAFEGKFPAFDCNSSSSSSDYSVLRSILAEIASEDTAEQKKGLMFYSRLYHLLHELKTHFVFKNKGLYETREEEKRRMMINSYIKKNFREPISLKEVANVLSFTPQYFSKYFKKLFGVNFHSYLTQYRLGTAMKELTHTDKSITAIAYDNGFPNLPAFIKEIKNTVKQTPTLYRRTYQAQAKEHEKINKTDQELHYICPKWAPDKQTSSYGETIDQVKENNNISVDTKNAVYLKKFWQEIINLGFVNDFEKYDFINHIKLIQNEVSFRYARFQGLFGKSMLSLDKISDYSFTKINRAIDFLVSVNLLPFIELGFKPAKINKDVNTYVFKNDDENELTSIEKYEDIIDRFLKNAVNRYGLIEVSKWRFEYWEPRDRGQFIYNDINTYVDQFGRIKRAIKKIVPDAKIGGPGLFSILNTDFEHIGKLIKKLKAKNSLPDFFSYYVFHFFSSMEDIAGARKIKENRVLLTKDELAKRIIEMQKNIEESLKGKENENGYGIQDPLLYITEWNLDFTGRDLIHDSLYKASFLIQNLLDVINSVDAIAYWLASDISAEYVDSDGILFGGPGLITRDGVRKPSFFAYKFLSNLGEKLLAKGDGYIITMKSMDEFVIILLNYKYISTEFRLIEKLRYATESNIEYLENYEKRSLFLEIINIYPGRYKVCEYILNSWNGSIYDKWIDLSITKKLQKKEIEWLERTCFPDLKIDFLDAKDSLKFTREIEPNEIRMLEISRVYNE